MHLYTQLIVAAGLALVDNSLAATCNLRASYSTPVVSNGWQAQLVAQGLRTPRSILFDSAGHLLVVQRGVGITALEFDDGGTTCLDVRKITYLVNSTILNHGIALSRDGRTLYASSSNAVYSWDYDSSVPSVGTTNRTLVTGMDNAGHNTRTLMISLKQPGVLVVSRGSDSNIDSEAASVATGHSQVKAFNLTALPSSGQPYDFTTLGRLLGWGLRNSVGVAEEPVTGGIYSVENSVDQIERNGVDIHQNNPGEELNFHGYLNASTENQGGNYGYPYCYALWDTSIPSAGNLRVGSQFTMDQSSTLNDTFCANERVPPRLTFQAHTAPLDIKFLPNGTEAYVSFHGSWDRNSPIGYKVSSLLFASGSPVATSQSVTSTTDIFSNPDLSRCPSGCFRPVGLALDSKDRLFVTSDSTGELYVLARTGSATATGTGGSGAGSDSSTAGPSATPTSGAGRLPVARGGWRRRLGWACVGPVVAMLDF